jgi:predicted amidohydrolase
MGDYTDAAKNIEHFFTENVSKSMEDPDRLFVILFELLRDTETTYCNLWKKGNPAKDSKNSDSVDFDNCLKEWKIDLVKMKKAYDLFLKKENNSNENKAKFFLYFFLKLDAHVATPFAPCPRCGGDGKIIGCYIVDKYWKCFKVNTGVNHVDNINRTILKYHWIIPQEFSAYIDMKWDNSDWSLLFDNKNEKIKIAVSSFDTDYECLPQSSEDQECVVVKDYFDKYCIKANMAPDCRCIEKKGPCSRESLQECKKAKIDNILLTCAKEKVSILVFPELAMDSDLTRYVSSWLDDHNDHSLKLVVVGRQHCAGVQSKHNNLALLFNASGDTIIKHEKFDPVIVNGKEECIQPRDKQNIQMCQTPTGLVSINICKDYIGTDSFWGSYTVENILSASGCDIVFVPAMTPKIAEFKGMAEKNATHRGIFTIVCNSSGESGLLNTSFVQFPDKDHENGKPEDKNFKPLSEIPGQQIQYIDVAFTFPSIGDPPEGDMRKAFELINVMYRSEDMFHKKFHLLDEISKKIIKTDDLNLHDLLVRWISRLTCYYEGHKENCYSACLKNFLSCIQMLAVKKTIEKLKSEPHRKPLIIEPH